MSLSADMWTWERPLWPHPAAGAWWPADNHPKGTEGTGGNIGAKHSDKAEQTGLAIISGRASKPVTHRGSGCSGSLSWSAAGHTAQTRSSRLCPPPPVQGRWMLKGWSGSLKSSCRHGARQGQKTSQSWKAQAPRGIGAEGGRRWPCLQATLLALPRVRGWVLPRPSDDGGASRVWWVQALDSGLLLVHPQPRGGLLPTPAPGPRAGLWGPGALVHIPWDRSSPPG